MSGSVTGAPNVILRIEGLLACLGATAAFAHTGGSWALFAALFLVPDLSMLGYLAGRKVGAMLYNAAHWYALPFACLALGALTGSKIAIEIGLIWAAHIGIDRTAGYGLKYFSSFGATHLGMKGGKKASAATVPAIA